MELEGPRGAAGRHRGHAPPQPDRCQARGGLRCRHARRHPAGRRGGRVLDAANMMEKQDLAVAGWVIEEGRALVIAVNKTDLLTDDRAGANKAWRKLRDRL